MPFVSERNHDHRDSISLIRLPDVKDYYTKEVLVHQRAEFPHLVSYKRFVELMPMTFVPLCVYLKTRFGGCSGISFLDSTKLAVCHTRHRSVFYFFVYLIAGLVAYTFREKKPSLHLRDRHLLPTLF